MLIAIHKNSITMTSIKTINMFIILLICLIFPLSPMWFQRSPFPCTVNFWTFCDDTYLLILIFIHFLIYLFWYTQICRVAIMLRLCLTFRFFYPNYAYKRLAYKKKLVYDNFYNKYLHLIFSCCFYVWLEFHRHAQFHITTPQRVIRIMQHVMEFKGEVKWKNEIFKK